MAFRAIVILVSLQLIHAEVLDLTCDQIKKFVDGHNAKRRQLAQGVVQGHPAAAEMKQLAWDEELAAKARNWASNNQFEHNPDANIVCDRMMCPDNAMAHHDNAMAHHLCSGRFKTGENLHRYSTTYVNNEKDIISQALDAWWNEYKDFQYRKLQSSDFYGSKMIGHYTQMVWSNSIYLGCAISKYEENGWHNFLTVCNYGPSGNMLGEKPYPSGNPSNNLICGAGDCSKSYGKQC